MSFIHLPDNPSDIGAMAGTYQLLGRLWMRELDQPLLNRLSQPPLKQAFADIGGSVPPESLEQLAREFCRLFIGPRGHHPPIQSVWQRGELRTVSTDSTAEFMSLVGYSIPNDQPHTPMDHLGLQLDLFGHLIAGSGEPSRREVTAEVMEVYHGRHLTWCSALLGAIQRDAELPFYRSLAEVTRECVFSPSSECPADI